MGSRYEVQIWREQLPGRGYKWETVWEGNSRVKALCSFAGHIHRRQDQPVQLVWR